MLENDCRGMTIIKFLAFARLIYFLFAQFEKKL